MNIDFLKNSFEIRSKNFKLSRWGSAQRYTRYEKVTQKLNL